MDDFNWALYVSALLTGLLFGYVLQRGGFCLTRALSNAVLMGDATILRAYVLAPLGAGCGRRGFAMGATPVSVGVLAPVRTWLQAPAVTLGGAAPTLHGLVG